MDHESKKPQLFVVTGAGGGIGRALCENILQEGHQVVATDIRSESLLVIGENLPAEQKTRFSYKVLDVTDYQAVEAVMNDIAAEFGRIDCIINNAGIMSCGSLIDADMAIWQRVLNINLMGVVYGSKACAEIMIKQGYGKIVNISSTAGVTPLLNSTAYAASKHAVVGFTRSLKEDLKVHGISVVLVIPGLIDTGIFDRAEDDGQFNSRTMIDKVPIKKCPPDKAARLIYWGISNNQNEIIFPLLNRCIITLYRWFPSLMTRLIMHNQHH
jgi:NAD(P)-dependent dehydrogenase (short-subunit alcohol dehydrogenase family)